MTQTELQTLFDKIGEQTEKNQLKWKAEADRTFRVDFPRSSIEISKMLDSVAIYTLNIYNSAGAIIGLIDHSFSSDAAAKLSKIYEKAYSLALQVDATVQDILAGLQASPKDVSPGIYAATFSGLPSGKMGVGVAIIGNGHINGGDPGYTYRGSYEVSGVKISASLKITRWDPSAVSIFGNLPNFDLALVGQFAEDHASLSLEGNVAQIPTMRIKIACRRIADALL
jgi:hypothetical protein